MKHDLKNAPSNSKPGRRSIQSRGGFAKKKEDSPNEVAKQFQRLDLFLETTRSHMEVSLLLIEGIIWSPIAYKVYFFLMVLISKGWFYLPHMQENPI